MKTNNPLPRPRFPNPGEAPRLRWGILGPGRIASDFTHALQQHTQQEVVACGSRCNQRAQAFAAAHGIARSYGSYEELVEDTTIDVVYIATPHSTHRDHAILAIQNGKHVLIEKPMAASAAEARTIAAESRAAGVLAMEAMWTRYLPQTDIARQLIDSGSIGEPCLFTADFGSRAEFDPTARLWDPSLGGGALLDLGVYPISWASFALGTPNGVRASGTIAATGVEDQASLLLSYPNGSQAMIGSSLRATTRARATLVGSGGCIEIDSPFWAPSGLSLFDKTGRLSAHWEDSYKRPYRQGMAYEAAALARYVTERRIESPVHTLDETISIISTIDEARQQLMSMSTEANRR